MEEYLDFHTQQKREWRRAPLNFPDEEEEEKGKGKGPGKGSPSASTERCFICGEPGHFARQCPNQDAGEMLQLQ